MAEAVPYGVAANILTSLCSSTFQDIASIYGVEKDRKRLETILSGIRAKLLDAEEQQEKSHEVKFWLKHLTEVLYDADDVLDAFAIKALRRKPDTPPRMKEQVREFFSSSNQLFFHAKMASRIKKIRERLDEIADGMKRFGFQDRVVVHMPTENSERETHSYVIASDIIGRKNDEKEIIEMLMSPSSHENVSVISVVGIGGLGKTTLVQSVYNHVNHFERKLWVCVSEEFEVKEIVRKILQCTTDDDLQKLQMEQLQERLRKVLHGRRYLLVMDDVWNTDSEKWKNLKTLLMGGAPGSKIVVTTREMEVAFIMDTKNPYELKGLNKGDSWDLFRQLAFREGQEKISEDLIAIGKEILKKCKGVPLAIRTLGSIMKSKTKASEWLAIQNSEIWRLPEDKNHIMRVLKLSYNHLPIHLRPCFTFCLLFPKDYRIQKDVLIQLWMAHGYIQSSNESDEHPEDIGNRHFNDLLSRSFFQDVERDSDDDDGGDIVSCKMHDLIHDLAQSIARTHFSVAKYNFENIYEIAHHLSLDPFLVEHSRTNKRQSQKGEQHMRTFFLLLPDNHSVCDESFNDKFVSDDMFISNFRHLRVLDLHNLCIKKVPRSIGKLEHLRYLNLSGNKIETLPDSIGNLYNLQTLKLSNCGELTELPSGIIKLKSLVYLLLKGCRSLTWMPFGLGRLTLLRQLTLFAVKKDIRVSGCAGGCGGGSATLGELCSLRDLRGGIHLRFLENVPVEEAKEVNMKDRKYLRELHFEWKYERDDDYKDTRDAEMLLENLQPPPNLKVLGLEGYAGRSFPSWACKLGSFLPHLVSTVIKGCGKCQHLPPFGQLRFLKRLRLHSLSSVEYMEDSYDVYSSPTQFFPSLEYLSLDRMDSLKEWWRREVVVDSVDNCNDGDENNVGTTAAAAAAKQQQQQLLPSISFPRLSRLGVDTCPALTSLPLHPHVEDLYLGRASGKLLLQSIKTMAATTITAQAVASSSSSSSSSLPPFPLSKLKSLTIQGINDLETLPAEGLQNLTSLQRLFIGKCPRISSLPEEGLRGLTSLLYLSIWECENLMSLSRGIQHLTALKELSIDHCKKLDLSVEEDYDGVLKLLGLSSLNTLRIQVMPKLVSLPGWLQHATSLASLEIHDCSGLANLPEWIGNLTSLEQLAISVCPALKSLPEGMHCLTSLKYLQIRGLSGLANLPERIGNLTSLEQLQIVQCPALKSLPEGMRCLTSLEYLHIRACPFLLKRCRRDRGEDWPKISHIPDRFIA